MVRDYTDSDLESLFSMYCKQGFKYGFPDISKPTFFARKVYQNGRGVPESAALLKLTAEAYFLHDGESGTPDDRWRRFLAIHESIKEEALRAGIDEVNAWIPPTVKDGFLRRLGRLGWTGNPYISVCYKVRT